MEAVPGQCGAAHLLAQDPERAKEMNCGARGVAGPMMPRLLPQDEKQQAQLSLLLGPCAPSEPKEHGGCFTGPIRKAKPKP